MIRYANFMAGLAEIVFLVLSCYATWKSGTFDAQGFGFGFGAWLLGRQAGAGVQMGLQNYRSYPNIPPPSNPDITPPPGG